MFETIKNWFGGFNLKVRAFFSGPGGAIIRAALTNAVETAGAVALSMLMEQAAAKVGSLDKVQSIPGTMKAAQAQDFLTNYARRAGIQASQSLINFAVEAAVQSLRTKQNVVL